MNYQFLFFDLDHTLWDYDKSARETLRELYEGYQLQDKVAFDAEALQEKFFEVNYQLWADYNIGKIDSEYLRTQRFVRIFEELGTDKSLIPANFTYEYVNGCPQKPHVIDGAFELLDHLQDRFSLHIITNGFEDVQHVKLEKSGLRKYFDEVVTSERAGGKKPGKEIFEFAMKVSKAQQQNSLMIGDNIQTDILGAKGVGIGQVYYNPEKVAHTEELTFEISHLSELKSIL